MQISVQELAFFVQHVTRGRAWRQTPDFQKSVKVNTRIWSRDSLIQFHTFIHLNCYFMPWKYFWIPLHFIWSEVTQHVMSYRNKDVKMHILSIGGFSPLTNASVIWEATELSKPEFEESGSGSLRMLGKLALLCVGNSDWRSERRIWNHKIGTEMSGILKILRNKQL